jgi:uncharacterized protein (DUF1778 family)
METITVELRLDLQQHKLLQQAASNWGFTLSEYLLELALNSIDQGVPTREKIELNENDAQLLDHHLKYPPTANFALKSAISDHQQKYGRW